MSVETLIWMLLALVALDLLSTWFGADSRTWTDPSYASWPGF
jgi:hypothetical protein